MTWEIVFKFKHIAGIFLVALLTTALYLTHGSYWEIVKVDEVLEEKDFKNVSRCDLGSGRWVYDNVSYPMYNWSQCRFIEECYACDRLGRKDHKYQNWRWQPHHCDLPKFNATSFLEKMRGKKIVYVGDSLMRNQWESMVCLIESAIHPTNSSIEDFRFSIPEYNVSVNFHWSPFLVESNLDNPTYHKRLNITFSTEAIETHGRQWNDADTLIFDSYAWWVPNEKNITLLWGTFGSSQAIYKKDRLSLRHFEMVMKTWSEWLELNINRTKTTMYYMSMSPSHSYGGHWGAPKDQNCYGETEPILPGEEHWGTLVDDRHIAIVKSTIEELQTRGVKVQYTDITRLSAYRKDAHPTIYGAMALSYRRRSRSTKPANPVLFSDCLHWCLPGVPDVWNQFLYSYIMDDSS